MLKFFCLNPGSELLRGKVVVELQSPVPIICCLGNESFPVPPFDCIQGIQSTFQVQSFPERRISQKAWLEMLHSPPLKTKAWMLVLPCPSYQPELEYAAIYKEKPTSGSQK